MSCAPTNWYLIIMLMPKARNNLKVVYIKIMDDNAEEEAAATQK